MKKCASCSKDLPDAALHCVFCGAKQAPAPAVQPGNAKTVMGYSSQELLQQMREQGVANVQIPGQPPASALAPAQASHPNAATLFPPDAAQAAAKPIGGPAPQSFSPAGSHGFSASAPRAPDPAPAPIAAPPSAPRGNLEATMLPQPGGFGGAPAPSAPRGNLEATMLPQPGGFGGAPPRGNLEATMLPQPGGFGAPPPTAQAHGHTPAPVSDAPSAPVFGPSVTDAPSAPVFVPQSSGHAAPARTSPTTQDAMRAVGLTGGHLGLWSIVFGVLLLGWFVAAAYPFADFGGLFRGDALISTAAPAIIGLLAIIVGAIPMGPAPKGAIIAVLGLGGLGAATATAAKIDAMELVFAYGFVVLLAGLVARGAYPSSMLARLLVTFGALAVLASVLVPNDGGIPLVQAFQSLGGADTGALVTIILHLAVVLLAVVSLLAWMPAPGTAGAPVLFWLLLLVSAAAVVLPSLIAGNTELATIVKWEPEFSLVGLASYGLGAFLGKLSA